MAAYASTKQKVIIQGIDIFNSGTINTTQISELITGERYRFPGSDPDKIYTLKIRTTGNGEIIWRYDTAVERDTEKSAIEALM